MTEPTRNGTERYHLFTLRSTERVFNEALLKAASDWRYVADHDPRIEHIPEADRLWKESDMALTLCPGSDFYKTSIDQLGIWYEAWSTGFRGGYRFYTDLQDEIAQAKEEKKYLAAEKKAAKQRKADGWDNW